MKCKSGKHEWLSQADADKCCNGYVRILVLGGGDNQQVIGDVIAGRAWMPQPQASTEQTEKSA